MTEPTPGPSTGTPGAPTSAAPATTPPAAATVTTPAAATVTTPSAGASDSAQAPAAGDPGASAAEKPWWDGITEAPVRELMEKKNYANPHELAMAYYNANKLVSGAADAVIVPSVDAPKEQWEAFYKKMGRPDSPDAYEFKHAEGVKVDPKMEAFGKKLFHDLGLHPAHAQKAVNSWNEFIGEYNKAAMDAARQRNDAQLEALEKAWGPELDSNLAKGREAAKVLGLSPDLVARVEEHVGTAAIIEFLALVGRATPEGKFIGGSGGGSNDPTKMTPAQAQQEINRLRADPEFDKKLNDKNNPEHLEAVDRMAVLYSRL